MNTDHKTRNNCDLEPSDYTAEPTEDSILVLDFIKLAAATAAASTAASKRGYQGPMNADGPVINKSQQGCKSFNEKNRRLHNRISPAQQQILNPAVLPAVHTETDLVQVLVAQRAGHELQTEAHLSARRMDCGMMSEGPFCRTWAGRKGLLAEVMLEGPHGIERKFGSIGHAAQDDCREA
jgi:hypothetical protein